jgi:hypothetical protein
MSPVSRDQIQYVANLHLVELGIKRSAIGICCVLEK